MTDISVPDEARAPIVFEPIGWIYSPFSQRKHTPIQPSRSDVMGRVVVLPEYEAGLEDVEGFSHLILLYHFDRADPGYDLAVTPFLGSVPRGLFATRYPRRPNGIGLSIVQLAKREGRVLHIAGIDVLDGTPLLDIKPYAPPFDSYPDAAYGWLEGKV